MLVSEFEYELPPELIAQEPLAERAASRMLHLLRSEGRCEDRHFREFPALLRPDDLVVFNNTRVFPARLYGSRSGARARPVSKRNRAAREFLKGTVEVLLISPAEEESRGSTRINADQQENEISVDQRLSAAENPLVWRALVRPGRKIGVGERLYFGDAGEMEAEVVARGEYGERTLRFAPVPDFFAVVERIGHVPLPPYIARADQPCDRERYQTVYAQQRGSVAAPTAGLHFTPEILERMRTRGIETVEITLHVGLGTFQPVHTEVVEEHKLHREWYSISESAAERIDAARRAGRRIVAVGTTTVRTLEYAAQTSAITRHQSPADTRSLDSDAACDGEKRAVAPGRVLARDDTRKGSPVGSRQSSPASHESSAGVRAGSGEADLFIYPGFQFRVVGALLTNFHLPRSTLLMLVSAFAGREFTLRAYRHAVEQRYRFYSYGDCMFIE